MPHRAYLRTIIVHLRNNLEAKLRSLAAIESCVNHFAGADDATMVERVSAHLDGIKRLHNAGSALLCGADAALAQARRTSPARRRPRRSPLQRDQLVH
jgi:hypothetical protein